MLPEQIRAMHDGTARARGEATVERGTGVLARIAAALIGFPKAGTNVPVTVTFTRSGGAETWRRDFAGKIFSSTQREGRGRSAGLVAERFGPFTFAMALVIDDEKLRLITRRWSLLGIPLPQALAPTGDSYEHVGPDGRFHFHVEIGFPWTGPIVHYRGWLVGE